MERQLSILFGWGRLALLRCGLCGLETDPVVNVSFGLVKAEFWAFLELFGFNMAICLGLFAMRADLIP